MNIQLAFGRQQELLERRFRGERIIEPRPSAEMLVLSGDIRNGTKAVASFADWPVPIVYVAGNYEFYENVWAQIRADLRKACAETNIHFLGNDFFFLRKGPDSGFHAIGVHEHGCPATQQTFDFLELRIGHLINSDKVDFGQPFLYRWNPTLDY